ncbi:MAG: hypothetical protein ABL933_06760 [Methyloglobulus sp.]|nr:hypothetical protein [Methyloglobulus sp.]
MHTIYILELCDTTGEHKPVARFESHNAFTSVNIGDRFDDTGWERLDGDGVIASAEKPKRYTVHSIKHLIIPSVDGLIVKYCLNIEPFHGLSSPVWGNT